MSWTVLSTGSLEGNRNLAFVALVAEKACAVKISGLLSPEANEVGSVKISGSSSLSESDSESLTKTGMSK